LYLHKHGVKLNNSDNNNNNNNNNKCVNQRCWYRELTLISMHQKKVFKVTYSRDGDTQKV